MVVLELKFFNSILMVDSTLSCNLHHLISNGLLELFHLEHFCELGASDYEQIALGIDQCSSISSLVLVVSKNVTVAEVTALNVHIERRVEWHVDLSFKQVIHQLNFAFQDEVDLIGVLMLVEQVFTTKEVHLLELWEELP